MSSYLRDLQTTLPSIISRWLLTEPSGPIVYDDVGGIELIAIGSPTLGLPSLAKGDQYTSAQGGSPDLVPSGFGASVTEFALSEGVSVEGISAADPNGIEFSIFNAPGQAQLQISGADVVFTVWTSSSNALTASGPIIGYPQHIVGTYDPVAEIQAIYVDGNLVASQSLTGSVASSTTDDTQLLYQPTPETACIALGQDIAIYGGALSANDVLTNFQAFAQVWPDPGHTMTYAPIGVTQ
jgi:hypothetical protein